MVRLAGPVSVQCSHTMLRQCGDASSAAPGEPGAWDATNRSPDEVIAHDRDLAPLAAWAGSSAVGQDAPHAFCRTSQNGVLTPMDIAATVRSDRGTPVLAEAGWSGARAPLRARPQAPMNAATWTVRFSSGPPPVPPRQRGAPSARAALHAAPEAIEVLSDANLDAALRHALEHGVSMPVRCEGW